MTSIIIEHLMKRQNLQLVLVKTASGRAKTETLSRICLAQT